MTTYMKKFLQQALEIWISLLELNIDENQVYI